MGAKSLVDRLVATALDFDTSGLPIVSYYLRLYAVEEILNEENRSGDLTQLASDLLGSVERFKNSADLDEDDTQRNAIRSLIHDQEKAKVYVSNFAMSLYNGKLQQIQHGPWDLNLRRGLWCCIDIFSCIIHLWDDPDGSYRKRIKYCKLYLSKLSKGELGGISGNTNNFNSGAGKQNVIGPDLNTLDEDETYKAAKKVPSFEGVEEPEAPPSQLDYGDFVSDADDVNTSEDKLNEMLERLKAKEEDDEVSTQSASETKEEESSPLFLPHVPKDVPKDVPSGNSVGNRQQETDTIPTFLDSEDECDIQNTIKEEPKTYTRGELNNMMEKSSKIEKIQRMAKYAISALNYEDLSTAESELSGALEILKSLK
ncbi:hypothetical protein HG535_0A00760 [Zygotorulaspora mrakii]|uniref:Vta1 C-terminal domain-containing protein n=1 Tax=Zygotorulaspora mrakii TaxID=42260 RepID=A0A7H9AVG4_ZYGMR|nr:uncharacterized protein HG535_0A00760 [Zygotorulaspora mrakii]QLG70137.1 hypothetical protein HG535_0A00760 [Zygotorulaspora mrakii]